MKILAKYRHDAQPPLLILYIHEAPHRRQHVSMIQAYRVALRKALLKIGVFTPIDHPIDLSVCFVNPTSPDFGNLFLALEQAMDDKTLTKPGILSDDSLIQAVTMSKLWTGQREPYESQPLNLPRFSTTKAIA